ncbi:hypothetical protein [Maricaulis sp. CAU 1757]
MRVDPPRPAFPDRWRKPDAHPDKQHQSDHGTEKRRHAEADTEADPTVMPELDWLDHFTAPLAERLMPDGPDTPVPGPLDALELARSASTELALIRGNIASGRPALVQRLFHS